MGLVKGILGRLRRRGRVEVFAFAFVFAFVFALASALASAICLRASRVAPVRGGTYFSFPRQRKVGAAPHRGDA